LSVQNQFKRNVQGTEKPVGRWKGGQKSVSKQLWRKKEMVDTPHRQWSKSDTGDREGLLHSNACRKGGEIVGAGAKAVGLQKGKLAPLSIFP